MVLSAQRSPEMRHSRVFIKSDEMTGEERGDAAGVH